jgi:hypothetical protein
MKKLNNVLLCLALALLSPVKDTFGQLPCYFTVFFERGFNNRETSFYINGRAVFEKEHLNTARRMAADEYTHMNILAVPQGDTSLLVANTERDNLYQVRPWLKLRRGWEKDLWFRIVIDGVETELDVDLAKGSEISLRHRDGKVSLSYAPGERPPGFAAPCYLLANFLHALDRYEVSFYINGKAVFEQQVLTSIEWMGPEDNRMKLLLVPETETNLRVANLYSRTFYKISSVRQLEKGWEKDLEVTIVLEGKESVHKLDLSKGNLIDIYYDWYNKKIVVENHF